MRMKRGLCSAVLGLHSSPVPYTVVKKMAKSHFGVLSKGVFQIRCFKKYHWWLPGECTIEGSKVELGAQDRDPSEMLKVN